MSNIVAHLLSIEKDRRDGIFTDLTEEQFDRLFGSDEFIIQLGRARTEKDVLAIKKEFLLEDLLLGNY